MKEITETLEQISYQKYLSSLKTEATRRLYDFRLSQFFKLYETNFNEFLELAREKPSKCRHYVLDYLQKEKERGISIGALSCERFAVKSILFYARAKEFLPKESFDKIDCDTWAAAIELGKHKTQIKDRLPTRDEIHNFLERLDLRGKALIEFLSSSGVRIGAIQDLKFKHVTEVSVEGYRFAKVIVYADTPDEYTSFISQEAYETLLQYKQHREYRGEKVNEESYVFVGEGYNGEGSTKPPSHQSFLIYFTKRWKELGLRKQKEGESKRRFEFPIFHVWRKYFKTQLESSGIKTLYAEMLLGHDTGLNRNYFRENSLEMAKIYVKAMEYLELEGVRPDDAQIEQVVEKRVIEKYDELEGRMKDIYEHRIAALEKRLEEKTYGKRWERSEGEKAEVKS